MSYTRIFGASGRNRTNDTRIFSPLLYLLSYRGISSGACAPLGCIMATPNGLEPSTSSVTGWRANRLHHRAKFGGGNNRARTCDPMLVRHVLSQLSYASKHQLSCLRISATGIIIQKEAPFVKRFFRIFYQEFLCIFTPGFSTENHAFYTFFRIFLISSGVKVYISSQN